MSAWLEPGRCLIIGHRGASSAAPENTLAAFRLAAEQGADGIELDVQATADGHLVVIHDATVDRTTDGTGAVAALTLEHLRRFDAGRKFAPPFAGERIPLLVEVFDAVGARLLIDVEVKAAGIEGPLVDLIRRMEMTRAVLISSFDVRVVARIRERAPELPAGLLQLASDPQVAVRLGVAACLPAIGALTADTVTQCRHYGLRVITWTVRTQAEARHAFDVDVDGIIADDPAFVRGLIKKD